MAETYPKLELLSNVPKTVKLLFDPKTAKQLEDKGYGPSWMTRVECDGQTYTWFINSEKLYTELQSYRKDDPIVVCKEEKKNEETKKVYHVFTVNPAFFSNQGRVIDPPPPSIREDVSAMVTFREQRRQRMIICLLDAQNVVNIHNATLSTGLLDHDDVRSIAISFAIDEQRQR